MNGTDITDHYIVTEVRLCVAGPRKIRVKVW